MMVLDVVEIHRTNIQMQMTTLLVVETPFVVNGVQVKNIKYLFKMDDQEFWEF